MRVTPLDIIQKQFPANRRGYDPDEVRGFLEEIRETMEDLLKENQRLREQIARRDAEIAELRESEHEVKETLLIFEIFLDPILRNLKSFLLDLIQMTGIGIFF